MNVPPFIPPQIEIAGNVAEEPYAVRVRFLKRVVGLHSTFSAFILSVALVPLPETKLTFGLVLTFGALLALSFVRGLAKGWRHEQLLSTICVPPLVAGLAMLVSSAVDARYPFWVFAVAPTVTLLYVALCGRDLSFLGMFVMTSMGALLATVAGYIGGTLDRTLAWEVGIGLVVYLLFYAYDLAALQTRRRQGEELGGVLDLFRDCLNFTTYPIRVVNHWRRHRIWSRG